MQLAIKPLNPNVAIDEVVLSGLVTNVVLGLMHFTDSTNEALVPIKFAPLPYILSNTPPRVVFSNDFENIGPGQLQAGDRIQGSTNSPAMGIHDWVLVQGPVTVVSNTALEGIGTNSLALARGTVSCSMPTVPDRRYRVGYALRGPAALSWWNGDVEPLSRRARDLIGDNHGAFFYQVTNTTNGDMDRGDR